ncbi:MAG: PDZ domain-containing protein [Pirellulales bacterium]|nr:PDZ domain-containing protein [Pirellulales bacterium]
MFRRRNLVRSRIDWVLSGLLQDAYDDFDTLPRRPWSVMLPSFVLAWSCASSLALAQPALEELERTLPPARAAADETADRAAAPRDPGYLGLIADDVEGVRGVRVVESVAAGPAAAADFREGDLIVAAAGLPITDLDDLEEAIHRFAAGDKVEFDVMRGNVQICLTATLGRRPEPRKPPTVDKPGAPPGDAGQPAQAVPRRLLGVRAVAVDEATRAKLDLSDTRGALVAEVFAGSAAAEAELPVGAVILTLDDAPVADPLDLARRVAATGPGRPLELGYFWDGALRHKRIVLPGASPAGAAPPAREVAKPAADDHQLDALQRRLDELDRRLARIEQLLERALGTPGAAAPTDTSSPNNSPPSDTTPSDTTPQSTSPD